MEEYFKLGNSIISSRGARGFESTILEVEARAPLISKEKLQNFYHFELWIYKFIYFKKNIQNLQTN